MYVLTYNHSSGSYGVQALEWPSTTGPTSVTVNANGGTGITFATNNITARTLTGTLTVAAGQNVSLTGSVKAAATYSLTLEQIRGRDRMKPVYSYFPAGHKGFVFLLHGTGGRAIYTINDFEFTQLIKDLVTDNFGVIVTEAEEATTGVDVNGNGKIQWNETPLDSVTNVDYANIKAITDTFYNRGITNRSKLRYSIGMSNGGYFSSFLSYMFKYKAGVSYCAQTANALLQLSSTPFQFCMARYDNQPEVSIAGNNAAQTNSTNLLAKGICSKYFIIVGKISYKVSNMSICNILLQKILIYVYFLHISN